MNIETDLGREVRQNVARILKRFEGCDIAAVKVVDLQKIDRLALKNQLDEIGRT